MSSKKKKREEPERAHLRVPAQIFVFRQIRGWKAFLLLPRTLLHKPPRGRLIPKRRLEEPLELFADARGSENAAEASARASGGHDDLKPLWRSARAPQLVQMGELSSGRQALEGAELAPGTLATLAALSDPERRPLKPRDPMQES